MELRGDVRWPRLLAAHPRNGHACLSSLAEWPIGKEGLDEWEIDQIVRAVVGARRLNGIGSHVEFLRRLTGQRHTRHSLASR